MLSFHDFVINNHAKRPPPENARLIVKKRTSEVASFRVRLSERTKGSPVPRRSLDQMPRLALIVFLAVVAHAAGTDFSKDVYPILQRACFECHGPEKHKADLRLDTASPQHLKIGTDLLRRVALPKEDKDAMPKRGDRLTTIEIDHLRDWITAGAKWPDKLETLKHWSYLPPQRPALPVVKNQAWPHNEIDRFILAKLEANNLTPSPPAAPEILIRRLSLDLTGLPPTPAEVAAFLKEHSEDPASSIEHLATRLLASKEFGVRWARPWLDLARYADSHGFQRDDLREVWAWRDWVVNALNANMPFDQFTLEQIAGDLLPNATPEQIIATGFHRCTPTNVEAGTEPEESRINQVIDRVNTTGAVWLGTTLECAQCHNHKYDPITQRDYYSLLAYYNNTEKEAERTNPAVPGSIQFKGSPFKISDPGGDAQRAQLAAQMKTLNAQFAAREKAARHCRCSGCSTRRQSRNIQCRQSPQAHRFHHRERCRVRTPARRQPPSHGSGS